MTEEQQEFIFCAGFLKADDNIALDATALNSGAVVVHFHVKEVI